MFNLLPGNLKEIVKSEYRTRFFIVVCLAILFVQMSFLIFILPSWLVSVYREKDAVSQKNGTDQGLSSEEAGAVTSIITSINTQLNVLSTNLGYPKALPLLNTILANKTKDIYLDEISYTSGGNEVASIVLQGRSLTRDSLVAYVKNLETAKSFKSVDLPVSNLTKDRNINFTLTLGI